MARPRQAKPKRSNSEAQEIEDLEQRLALLDPVLGSADGQNGQGGLLSVQSGCVSFVYQNLCLLHFAARFSAVKED